MSYRLWSKNIKAQIYRTINLLLFLVGRQREDYMLRTFEKGVSRKTCMSNMDKVTEAGENRIPNGLMA